MPAPTRVYLETGKTWVFAAAVDWPGWCRRGRGEEAALAALDGYAARYAEVAGPGFRPGEVQVIGRVAGTASTDFGAPGAQGEWDHEPVAPAMAARDVDLLERSWRYLDGVVAGAPAALRKGPRGGGRDRDAIVDHVREAERSYGRRIGVRVPPRTPWSGQRAQLAAGLRAGRGGAAGAWPARYACRRIAWHVLDHAWEIQDRS